MLLILPHKYSSSVITWLDIGNCGNTSSSLIFRQMKHGRRRTCGLDRLGSGCGGGTGGPQVCVLDPVNDP